MNAAAVAVIGMAGRFPGAPDVETYWANLLAGVESVVTAPGVPGGFGVLEAADHFDADYFGCSPLEALVMDPQHRLLLECAVEALEHAGHGARAGGPVTGVFAGASQTDHLAALLASRDRLGSVSEYQLRLGSGMDFLTTRVTYKLDLRGPGVTVQTACSTSLAAIHLAAQALLAGECEIALAGGVCAHVPPPPYSVPEEGGILAPDGRCRAFDARATGTVGGNAVGFVVLRPLDEALAGGDHIHAVLRGSAMNNDGSRKVGYTAPSVDGQAAAIAAAHAVAEVEPDSIGYVEAHGTGTPVGDPIEIAGLTLAFGGGAGRRGLCRIGSVKTNIGHTDAAAGVAGFIKAVLAVERGVIPPSLHFTEPNPECRLPDSPFEVCTEPFEWPDRPRRAGVSSFGIGGTNVHAVLEEPPAAAAPGRSRPYHLVPVSARTDAALDALTGRLTAHLRDHPAAPLADVAWTLQTGRHAHPRRRFAVAESGGPGLRDFVTATAEPARPPVAFLFPGQGGQHVGMGRDLYEHEPAFRERVDECSDLARPRLGLDLRDVLYPSGDPAAAGRRLASMAVGQPAVFAVEYALAGLWRTWGIEPDAVLGHSLGAYAAACVAGVLSVADAIGLVIERGRLLQSAPPGAMLAVPLGEEEVAAVLDDGLSLAAVNGPAQTVVSGPAGLVDALAARLQRRGVEARRLHIDTAAHSTLVAPVLEAFRERVAGTTLRAPAIPWVSDTTGAWVSAEEAGAPAFWTDHMRRTVRFTDALSTLLAGPRRALLEVGPGRTLTALVRQHPGLGPGRLAVASLPHPTEAASALASVLDAAGRLWLRGAPIEWRRLHDGHPRRRLALPAYPFQRRRYALDEPPRRPRVELVAAVQDVHELETAVRPELATRYRRPRTAAQREVAAGFSDVLGIRRVGLDDDFFELGGDSLIAARLVARLRERRAVELRVRDVLQASTVRALAARVARRNGR